MTDCPGLELSPEDHRVLRQLSMRTRAASGAPRNAEVQKLAKALSIDESAWQASVSELIHMKYLERVDGTLYLNIRCTCAGGEDPPEWLAKHLQSQRKALAPDDPWKRIRVSRRKEPSNDSRKGHRPPGRDYPPRGGVGEATTTVASSKQKVDGELAVGASTLQPLRVKARSAVSEPAAEGVTTLRDLRMMFKSKWDNSGILDKLKLPAMHVLDPVESGAFVKSLKIMRYTEGLSCDQILAMMDTFMAMVLSREISIEGKHVWRVFVARRTAFLERSKRTQRFGSGEGILHDRGQGDEVLDRMMRRQLDPRFPSE